MIQLNIEYLWGLFFVVVVACSVGIAEESRRRNCHRDMVDRSSGNEADEELR